MDKEMILKVKGNKNGQRRITIPKKDKTLKHDDLVRVKKVKII